MSRPHPLRDLVIDLPHRVYEHSLVAASNRRHRERRSHFVWLGLEPLEGRQLLSAVTWDGGGDGVNWTSADNWSDNQVPDGADDVTIDAGGTINLTGVQSVLSMTMTSNTTLSLVNSSLALGAGPSNIGRLVLTGTGTVSTTGGLILSGTTSMDQQSVLAGPGAITNTGTMSLTGAPDIQTELRNTGTITQTGGTLEVRGAAAKVRVLDGGVFNLNSGASLSRPDGGQGLFIEDEGLLRSNGGTTNGALVVDGGDVNVTAGGLIFNGGASLHDATFNVAGGAFVAFNTNQQNAVSGTITGTGTGQIIINGSSSFDLASDTVFNFAKDQLVFQNSASINGPGTLTNAGDINGSPVLNTKLLITGTFTPAGVVTFADANAELRVLAGGTFEATPSAVSLTGIASAKGLIIESGGMLLSQNGFASGGIPVQVLGGTLKTAGGILQFNGTASFDGATLDTTGGGQIFFQNGSNTAFSGVIAGIGPAGTVIFANGPATFNVATGGATLSFPAGMAVFNNATINGPGVLTSVGELLFQPSNLILRTELRIEGKLNLVGTNPNMTLDGSGGLLRIANGGLFFGSSNVNGHVISASNGGAGVVVDLGGVFQSAGNLAVTAPFNNHGTVVSDSVLRISGPIAQISGTPGSITLTGGAWIQHANSFLDFVGTNVNTIGAAADVTIGSGNFRVPPFTSLANNAGILRLTEGQNFLTTSQFANSGTITISPGSRLTVGNFTQAASGATEFQIAGANTNQIGTLVATGAASLAGTARVVFASGFTPAAGQNFPLMTFASRTGGFATIKGLSLGHAEAFEAVYGATGFSLNSLVNAADLRAESITPPTAGIAGQNVTFSYSVSNPGAFVTLAADWTDVIYLSRDGAFDASDILLTRVPHSGALAAGGSYTNDVTVPLVGALPDSYRLIVVTDAQGFVADANRGNNVLASSSSFTLDVPALTPGTPLAGTIRNGQGLVYRVTLPDGLTPTFTFNGALAGQAEIYESLGVVPTRANYDVGSFAAGSTVQRITGDATAAATYYILLHGREAAGAGTPFSLIASGIGFDLAATSVTHGANIGKVTTTLTGSRFTPATTFSLVPQSGAARAAEASYFHDGSSVDATFNLAGLAAGEYSIVADNDGAIATLSNGFTVMAGGSVGTLQYSLSVPRYIRPPFNGTAVTLNYENAGDTDLSAPLFTLLSDNSRIRLADQSDFSVGAMELLGVSGGLTGVLSPGERGQIDIFFEPINATAHERSNFEVTVADFDPEPIDLALLKASLKPVQVADDAWDAVFTTFAANIGATVGSYKAALVENANYLGQFGPVSAATTRLVEFELAQVGDFGAIANRFALGAMGRGQAVPFSNRARETAGLVTISDGISSRFFIQQSDGTYTGLGLDAAQLTKAIGGGFQLDEGNGTITSYRAGDGLIEYVQDANGNRITAGRDGAGRLLTLTENVSNHATTFAYNAQGRIASTTDSVGRVTTYGYDTGGEHLTTISTSRGVTSLTYTPTGHAIASITGPNGVPVSFTYDSAGRVASETMGSGPGALTTSYTYDATGGVTATDAAGHASRAFRAENGAVVRTIDQLGRVISMSYDELGRLVATTDPSGVSARASLDAAGALTGVARPSRAEIGFSYSDVLRRVESVTSPRGGVTELGYDGNGNLLSTLLPDGFGDQFEYDTTGRVVASTDADGARTVLTYDAASFLTRRDFADGTHNDYAYDAHGNLITASSAEGATTLAYDAADRITSVTYPNGKSITITYDAAGRRATVSDQTGFTVRYSYDTLGRIDQVRDTANALLVDYSYDTIGQLASETRGNGSITDYTRDILGRATSITHRDGLTTLEAFTYTYNDLGKVKTSTDHSGTTTYGYDLDGQLVSAALPGGRIITYSYDADGNRVVVSDSSNGITNYSSNLADQYTSAGGETLTYDHQGRVASRTSGAVTTTYTYDREGRLAGVVSPGSTIAYHYDALGNRVAKSENGVRTDFAYDPVGMGTIFGEFRGGNTVAHYATGMGVAARANAAGVSFYHFDVAGNTALVTDATRASVAQYSYLPFGVAAATGALAQPFTFGGRLGVQDDAGDLYFMRARHYDAKLGRFTTRDPLGFSGGDANPYRYVGNDPINGSDPAGLLPLTPTQAAAFVAQYGEPALSEASLYIASLWTEAEAAAVIAGVTAEELAVSNMFGQIVASLEGQVPTKALAIYDGATDVIADLVVDSVASEAPAVSVGLGTQLLNGTKNLLNPANLAKGLKAVLTPKALGKGLLLGVGIEAAKYSGKNIAAPAVIAGFKKIDDYFRAQRENQPIDPAFTPDFIRKNADNVLFNVYRNQALIQGKSVQDAILEARAKVKKLENELYRNTHPPGGKPVVPGGTAGESEVIRPEDPNNIIGPAGAGADPGPDIIEPGQFRFDGFVSAAVLPYRIEFENKPSASAPAQVVRVTQTLDSDLNLSTFRFTRFGFGDYSADAPAGFDTNLSMIIDAAATLNVRVRIDAALNPETGVLDVTYTSLDPATNDVPFDPFAGFLPPNDATGRGDGFLTYTVEPKTGLATGTDFTSIASIVFDTEDAIATPTVTNTLDLLAPNSSISALPATTARQRFVVRWTGQDDAGGAGLHGFTVLFRDNGGVLQTLLTNTPDTAVRFTGEVGHTYQFFSQAIDRVGNIEPLSDTPDATITVVAPTLLPIVGSRTFTDVDGDSYTVKLAGPGTVNAVLLDPDGDGRGSLDMLIAEGATTASKITIAVKKAGNGNGLLDIGDVTVTGDLGALVAPTSNLIVNGLDVSGFLGAATIRDLMALDPVLAHPMIRSGGAGTGSQTSTITLRQAGDGAVIDIAGAIASLTAAQIGAGTIEALSVTSLTVKGDAKAGLSPIFGADLTLTGADAKGVSLGALKAGRVANANIDAAGAIGSISVIEWLAGAIEAASITSLTATGDKKSNIAGDFSADVALTNANLAPTLGKLTVAGTLRDVTIRSAGTVSAVTLGAMNGSRLLVGVAQGVTSLAPDAASFLFQPTKPSLGSMTVKGLVGGPPSLLGSIINAWNIGKATLKLVDSASTGEPFGIAASVIGVLSFQAAGLNTGKPVTLKSLDTPADLSDPKKNPSAVTFPVGQFTLQMV